MKGLAGNGNSADAACLVGLVAGNEVIIRKCGTHAPAFRFRMRSSPVRVPLTVMSVRTVLMPAIPARFSASSVLVASSQ